MMPRTFVMNMILLLLSLASTACELLAQITNGPLRRSESNPF